MTDQSASPPRPPQEAREIGPEPVRPELNPNWSQKECDDTMLDFYRACAGYYEHRSDVLHGELSRAIKRTDLAEAALRTEREGREKAERDAARYRWLRNMPPWNAIVSVIDTDDVPDDVVHIVTDELDEVIDRQIAAHSTGGGDE